ncbi:MAG: peptidoglycan bridge formation glycyltransferase FemA/FemB family protein [Chloroflexi bacterium]|nr:peptidoglycan bridge formation glycyltransferase FemA/FemB family protein [Chloroflexota bacterium]
MSTMEIYTSTSQLPDFHTRWLELCHESGHILQHPLWARFKEEFGWKPLRVAIGQEGKLWAGAQILLRPLPLGFHIAYIPRGPMLRQQDVHLLRELVRAIDQVLRGHRTLFLKMEPNWEDTSDARELLRAAGFRPSPQTIQPRSTIQVDLRPDPETILARMKSKWRYNIRLARRKGVLVRPAEARDLPHFLRLLEETARRDAFALHSPDYYRRAWELLVPAGLGTLLMAWYQDMPLAGIFVTAWNRTGIYMYGASSNRERQRMPNHLLQWEGMMWARNQGCTVYDMWGIPDEVGAHPEVWQQRVPDRTDGLWGVFRFKQGFGGRIVRMVGAWDRVYNRAGYWAYQLFLSVRR